MSQWKPYPLERLKMSSLNQQLRDSVEKYKSERAALYDSVRESKEFKDENLMLYDFDILCNVPSLFELFSGEHGTFLDSLTNKTLIDIGASNGDLGFTFSDIGFRVTLLDKSHICSNEKNNAVRQNAPLVASMLAKMRQSHVQVLDYNIDGPFDEKPLMNALSQLKPEQTPARYGLGVAFGLLYHLKNPYGFVESLTKVCDYLVIGTWVFSHLSTRIRGFENEQMVYLLKDCELADDPTNYWLFTEKSFETLVERCGWEILNRKVVKSSHFRSVPKKVKARVFFLLKNKNTTRTVH